MRPHIPPALAEDKAVVILITRWRNLLVEHAHCKKRVAWTTKNASALEKQRRTRRWEIEATLNEIEYSLLRACADATHHHEIYTKPKVDGDPLAVQSFSRFDVLLREYYRNRRIASQLHPQRNEVNRKRTRARHRIVEDIVALQWRWLSALFKAVHSDSPLPPKRKTDYRVLRPKRLKTVATKLKL